MVNLVRGADNERANALSPAAVGSRFQNINWTTSAKLLWQYVIDQAPIDVECLQSSGQSVHVSHVLNYYSIFYAHRFRCVIILKALTLRAYCCRLHQIAVGAVQ